MTIATIRLLDGRQVASNHRGAAGLTADNTWSWILDCLAAELDCRRADISIIEADDDEPRDLIAINGIPVAYLQEQP
jgi:hypothetical protein